MPIFSQVRELAKKKVGNTEADRKFQNLLEKGMKDGEYWCIKEVDRIEVKGRRNPCPARLREEGRHVDNKIRGGIGMKIAIEDSKRWNIPKVRKRIVMEVSRVFVSWQ